MCKGGWERCEGMQAQVVQLEVIELMVSRGGYTQVESSGLPRQVKREKHRESLMRKPWIVKLG